MPNSGACMLHRGIESLAPRFRGGDKLRLING